MNRKITIALLMALIAISLFIPYVKADTRQTLFDDGMDALLADTNQLTAEDDTNNPIHGSNFLNITTSAEGGGTYVGGGLSINNFTGYSEIHFSFYGNLSGRTISLTLYDGANTLVYNFVDNFVGWNNYTALQSAFVPSGSPQWNSMDSLYFSNFGIGNYAVDYIYLSDGVAEATPTPAPTATPIPQDMATSTIMASILLVIFVITNIIFLGVVNSAMVRFLFALLTLMIGIASLTMQNVTFSPYLQMVTVVMSLLCMVLAAKAKG